MQIRVYYEDTDVGGVVYHSNYINFCERARSELFFKRGASPIFAGCHFVVRKLNARYIKPALFGDILVVSTGIKKLKYASLLLEQIIYRDEQKIFSLDVEVVFMKNQKIAPIPKDIKEVFADNG
jgi:acyl-CoA thioester hydrolase